MTQYFNDSPIETAADDRYGVVPFAKALARSILKIKDPVGTTIALNGQRGMGKSSAVNLIRSELQKEADDTLIVTEFRCWWYRGEQALTLAFFQMLNAVLRDKLGDKVKDLIPKIGRGLLQAGPAVGAAAGGIVAGSVGSAAAGGLANFVQKFFPDGDPIEHAFQKLSGVLQQERRRFLVIIDDIDRLNPEEALGIFRLVKSVGHLPNVLYLLSFDRALADKTVAERYPSEGPHYLEKMLQFLA